MKSVQTVVFLTALALTSLARADVNPIIARCAHIHSGTPGVSSMSTAEFKALLNDHVADLASETMGLMDGGYGQERLGQLQEIKESKDYRVCTARGASGFWYDFAGRRSKACNRIALRENASGIGRELDGMGTMFRLLAKGMALGKAIDDEIECLRGYAEDSQEIADLYDLMIKREGLDMEVSFGVVNGYGAEKVNLLQERNDQVISRVGQCMSGKSKAKGRRCSIDAQIQYYSAEFPGAVLKYSEALKARIKAQFAAIEAFQE